MIVVRRISFWFSLLLAVSCGRSGLVDNVPAEYVVPGKIVSLDPEFRLAAAEVLRCCGIQLVGDSLLVLQDRPSEDNPWHFKAYSTVSFDCLGSFVRYGRGPGEMLSPHIVKSPSGGGCLVLNDNPSGKAYMVDVLGSIASRKMSVMRTMALPAGVVDWILSSGSEQFALLSENGKTVFRTLGDDGVLNTFRLDDSVDGERYVTWLSAFLASGGNSGKVAVAMIFFPLVNIFDTAGGHMCAIVTDRKFRSCSPENGGLVDMNSVQYHEGISACSEYIFVTYKGLPLSRLNDAGEASSIHVFDWDGNFICEVRVAENIGDIAYDGRSGRLYCIDKSGKGGVVCYDLGGVLPSDGSRH